MLNTLTSNPQSSSSPESAEGTAPLSQTLVRVAALRVALEEGHGVLQAGGVRVRAGDGGRGRVRTREPRRAPISSARRAPGRGPPRRARARPPLRAPGGEQPVAAPRRDLGERLCCYYCINFPCAG